MAFLCRFLTILSTITVSWFNTWLDVPLQADIDDYMNEPYAVLMIDDEIIQTPATYQKNGVNYTFQSTIQTTVVRAYVLYMEVYFPTYNIRDTKAITFNVYDDISPEIIHVPSFVIEVGSEPPDLLSGFSYEDNYDDIEMLSVTVNDHMVHYDCVGTYDVIYNVQDTSFNETVVQTTISVVDTTPPRIEQLKPMIIERGELHTLYDYFDVVDAYDLSPIVIIDDHDIDYDHVGSYHMSITATDHHENQTELFTSVQIVDTTPPILRLMTQPPPISVHDNSALTTLSYYIIDIKDLDESINKEQATIVHDIQIDHCGTYHIDVYVSDAYGNEAHKTLEIEVIDLTPPTITLLQPFIVPVFSTEPLFSHYIAVSDNYDDTVLLDMDIDTSPHYDQVGMYPVIITVEDTSHNKARFEDYIYVIDDIPPTVLQINDIVVTDFQPHVYESYFSYTDNYDETASMTIEVDDSAVDYQQLGIYPIEVIVSDQSYNLTTVTSEIFVVDVISPTLTLQHERLTIAVHQSINLRSFILSAFDNYDPLTLSDVVMDESLNVDVVGVYDIVYRLTDQSGNETTKTLTIIVDDFTAPIINVNDITINQYDTIDLLDGVDVIEETTSVQLICYPAVIDTQTPGEQIITYVAQDGRGNYALVHRTITIMPIEEKYEIEDFIPTIVILLSGSIIIIAIRKKG